MYFIALYGILFKENSEAAFSNYRLWEALGAMVSFGYSSYLCASTKIIFMIAMLSLGMVNYLGVEYLNKNKIKVIVRNINGINEDNLKVPSPYGKENSLSQITSSLTIKSREDDLSEIISIKDFLTVY